MTDGKIFFISNGGCKILHIPVYNTQISTAAMTTFPRFTSSNVPLFVDPLLSSACVQIHLHPDSIFQCYLYSNTGRAMKTDCLGSGSYYGNNNMRLKEKRDHSHFEIKIYCPKHATLHKDCFEQKAFEIYQTWGEDSKSLSYLQLHAKTSEE